MLFLQFVGLEQQAPQGWKAEKMYFLFSVSCIVIILMVTLPSYFEFVVALSKPDLSFFPAVFSVRAQEKGLR